MLAVISACPLVLALLGVLSILPFFSLMNFLPVSLIIVFCLMWQVMHLINKPRNKNSLCQQMNHILIYRN